MAFSNISRYAEKRLQVLEKAEIEITIEYLPEQKQLHVTIIDSGKGFDEVEFAKVDNIEKSYGKGISLVKELCESVHYSNNGNTVDIVFKI